MLPVAFDNWGGLAGTEQRGGAAALRRRVCTTVVVFVRVAVLFPACFHLIFKAKSHMCHRMCQCRSLRLVFSPLPGRKARMSLYLFLFVAPPGHPLHSPLSGSWRGGRRGGQGRVSKGSQVSGWWLRWDTWHAPEGFV